VGQGQLLSRGVSKLPAREVAWLTAFSRLQWRNRGDFHGLPAALACKCELSVCPASQCSSNESTLADKSRTALGISWVTRSSSSVSFLHQRCANLLRIFQPVQFVQENIMECFSPSRSDSPFLRELLSWPWSERVRNVRHARHQILTVFPACFGDQAIHQPKFQRAFRVTGSPSHQLERIFGPTRYGKLWTQRRKTFGW